MRTRARCVELGHDIYADKAFWCIRSQNRVMLISYENEYGLMIAFNHFTNLVPVIYLRCSPQKQCQLQTITKALFRRLLE